MENKALMQEMVDKNYQWFVVEKHEPSMAGSGASMSCMYIADDGRRCGFAACLNKAELEAAHLHEGDIASLLITKEPLVFERFVGLEDFSDHLQRCHDGAAQNANHFHQDFVQDYVVRMQTLCGKYHLVWPGDVVAQ